MPKVAPDVRGRVLLNLSAGIAFPTSHWAPCAVTDQHHPPRSTGAWEPGARGGNRRSARIEAHAAEILSLVKATPDMTLAEIADDLLKVQGKRFVRDCSIAATVTPPA